MRILIIIFVLVLIFILSCGEAEKKGNTNTQASPVYDNPVEYLNSRISFDSKDYKDGKLLYDFSKVYEGETVEHIFEFTNSGEQTLKVISVKSSCGCTVVKYPEEVIPGEKGEIKVTFDTRNRNGFQQKFITIQTNSKKDKTVRLIFEGFIIKILDCPKFIKLDTVSKTADITKSIEIKISEKFKNDMAILSAKFIPDYADIQLKKRKKSNIYDLNINMNYKKAVSYVKERIKRQKEKDKNYSEANPYKLRGYILLKTDFEKKKEHKIHFDSLLKTDEIRNN